MRVTVTDTCQGCGQCEAAVPDVFRIHDDGFAVALVDTIPEPLEQDVRDAADQCPTEAIELTG
ncbi:ferredoxin [Actinomadura sp. LD22]|uniref:Ferredoxin n=1 Tax=Actinomadura physcomitrii TaxID=2650748 RepID=A0A6I4MKH5_9ACTN|nr:ferredoxin [Actinomadura physcomitrii]MWA03209.1 ferredoxin [Actinomadura physcomitrii]